MVVKTKQPGAKGECQCASLIIDHLCAFYGNLPEDHAKDIRTSRRVFLLLASEMTSKPSGNTETKKTKLVKLVTFAVGICSNQ